MTSRALNGAQRRRYFIRECKIGALRVTGDDPRGDLVLRPNYWLGRYELTAHSRRRSRNCRCGARRPRVQGLGLQHIRKNGDMMRTAWQTISDRRAELERLLSRASISPGQNAAARRPSPLSQSASTA